MIWRVTPCISKAWLKITRHELKGVLTVPTSNNIYCRDSSCWETFYAIDHFFDSFFEELSLNYKCLARVYISYATLTNCNMIIGPNYLREIPPRHIPNVMNRVVQTNNFIHINLALSINMVAIKIITGLNQLQPMPSVLYCILWVYVYLQRWKEKKTLPLTALEMGIRKEIFPAVSANAESVCAMLIINKHRSHSTVITLMNFLFSHSYHCDQCDVG